MFNSNCDIRDYDSSFSDGVWQSLRASLTLSFCLSIFISIAYSYSSSLKFPLSLMVLIPYISLVMGFVTLIFSMIFVYSIVIILKFFHLDNELNSALVCGLSTFVFMMLRFSGDFKSIYYILIVYAMVCSYAFMHGYKRVLK